MTLETPSPVAPPPIAQTPNFTHWGLIAYAVALGALIVDQISKFWVLDILDLQSKFTVKLLPIFSLTMVWNPGVSFGFLRAGGELGRLMLAAFAAVVVGALAFWVRNARRPFLAIGLGLVMGGAVGNNLIDGAPFAPGAGIR